MTDAAREWEGWRAGRATQKAWTVLFSFIADRLRTGQQAALRASARNMLPPPSPSHHHISPSPTSNLSHQPHPPSPYAHS